MGKNVIIYSITGILLILLQALMFNFMTITSYLIPPFVFISFILLLPFDTPRWSLLTTAFFTGLVVDIFTDTGGIFAGALVFTAFIRPFWLKAIAPYDGYEQGTLPRISYYGWRWKINYTIILSLSFNIVFFLLDNFSFTNIGTVILKTVIGTLYTSLSILVFEWAFFRK